MSAQHTPGPWAVKGRIHSSGECVRIESRHAGRDHLGYQIADVLDANDFPQNAANARLIAAAPDLLAALQGLMARHNDGSSEGPWAEWDAAAEAIAKATGAAS